MEHPFSHEQFPEEMLWLDPVPASLSAFAPYTNRPINELGFEKSGIGSKNLNMNKRMMEFLRSSANAKIEAPAPEPEPEPERQRCYRHMISERMRRQNQKQSYLALHHMLPFGTKNEKNAIVKTAVVEIQEMEKHKEELQRRNRMLEMKLAAKEDGGAKIRLKVANPSSGIDSMIEVVKCLKDLGLKTTSIHSHFSDLEFSAELEIETQIGAEEVEKEMQRTLIEVERKHHCYFQEGWGGIR